MSPYSSPSLPSLDVRDQFITTTVFANPTFLGSQSSGNASAVPVAAIAGGAAAGVVLAVLAVCGWKWWGRNIKEREKRELEKRKAIQAATAYRRSVLTGGKKLPSRSDPRRPRLVQFAAPVTPQAITNTSPAISAPRPLKASSREDTPVPVPSTAGTPRRLRAADLRGGKAYRPLRPSPLSHSSSTGTRAANATAQATSGAHIIASEQGAPRDASVRDKLLPLDEKDVRSLGTSRSPRIKASLSSLTGEARRQSRASQNSGSEQSRHSSARRWSWWSLINGPGFSFRQIGIGTGKNRLSDTSSLTDWQEEDPSLPVGYAYSELDQEPGEANGNPDFIAERNPLHSNHDTRGTEKSSGGGRSA